MKSTLVAYLLWFFFGLTGAHRFYLRRPALGIVYLAMFLLALPTGSLTLIFSGLLWLVDLFLIPGMVWSANRAYRRQHD